MADTKYYLFDDRIGPDQVKELVKWLGDNPGSVEVCLRSEGGECHLSSWVLNVLNNNKDRVTLVGVEWMKSAAFSLFVKYEGRKMLSYGTMGMYHYGALEISIAYNSFPNYKSEGKCQVEYLELMRKNNLEWCKGFMNEKELREYEEGKDVYFGFERMIEICKEVIII